MSKSPKAAPSHDEDGPIRKRRANKTLSWILFGLVILGLGGFGVENFGGRITAIGTVGDREISANDYARTLQGQINQIQRQFGTSLPFEQLQALGIDRQALEQVVTGASLAAEAGRVGLSAGDESVAQEIAARPDFQGVSGGFDKETYKQTLEQNNLTTADFETTVREDIARSLLQGTISGGLVAPGKAVAVLQAWQGETRRLAFLPLTEADLTAPLAVQDEAAVKAFYEANLARYTRPEAKRIRYVALTPEAAAADLAIEEAKVQELYDARKDQYVRPEKRLVERLVFPDEASATEAKARLDAGTTFEALVEERKLTLADIDLGDVTLEELGAAGEAVFGLAAPGVVGPIASDLGPALFRMNAVLAAETTPLDAVREDLTRELRQAEGAKRVSARVEEIDDLLAGGGTLDDMAKTLGLAVETTDYAAGADDNIALAANPGFQKAIGALAKDSFPEALFLEDGSLMAMEFVETVAPAPVPLDEIKDRVTQDARDEALRAALAARAEAIRSELASGKALADFGTPVGGEKPLARGEALPGLAASLTETGFAMAPGEVKVIAEPGLTGLLALQEVIAAPASGEDAEAARASLANDYRASIAGDVFTLYSKALTDKAGLTLDQAAINAVHSSILQN